MAARTARPPAPAERSGTGAGLGADLVQDRLDSEHGQAGFGGRRRKLAQAGPADSDLALGQLTGQPADHDGGLAGDSVWTSNRASRSILAPRAEVGARSPEVVATACSSMATAWQPAPTARDYRFRRAAVRTRR